MTTTSYDLTQGLIAVGKLVERRELPTPIVIEPTAHTLDIDVEPHQHRAWTEAMRPGRGFDLRTRDLGSGIPVHYVATDGYIGLTPVRVKTSTYETPMTRAEFEVLLGLASVLDDNLQAVS